MMLIEPAACSRMAATAYRVPHAAQKNYLSIDQAG
jgi:hypothetical protein